MKIIRQGEYHGPETMPHRFECVRCGCVWEAEPGEYHINQLFCDDHRFTQDFACRCPTCDTITYARD